MQDTNQGEMDEKLKMITDPRFIVGRELLAAAVQAGKTITTNSMPELIELTDAFLAELNK